MRFRWPLSTGGGGGAAATSSEEEPMDDDARLCQALLVRVREPMATVREAVSTIGVEYARIVSTHGDPFKMLGANEPARARLAALGADAERRLAKLRPAPDVAAMGSVMIGRVLDGDPKARTFLDGIDPVVVAALAVREACARGRSVISKLDDDVADFTRSDSAKEKSKKKRRLVVLAKCGERCKTYAVTLDNLGALLEGRASTSIPKHVDSCSSTASIRSAVDDELEDGPDVEDYDETVDLRHWRTDSYEDFLADTGPVSF